ncbi:PIKK family atypical protein kinase [Trichomonas vaginalis G3]|uniref:Serine/threonine-protein kinase TOR n=1 Tax=Trichomonas vaginalis (strain ATCC PRA-98 / G3) TaxID=412133 RepID=A2FZM6_TRIV3|nr:ataxia telangiectasia mutated (ATM) -related family [Trichomonas vaginalis G3]EAX89640.1 PIKK family atypical protein kinase [Trichomonas vaginalis G3]KAI5509497.1 ataxia telangiectasia mutated (ATM) -related family [Trichomonas vaginalis G3]|eukprot:XP_001302570.1 PIKK family atypical protein kinase [Trichomonas vaginalis G3]
MQNNVISIVDNYCSVNDFSVMIAQSKEYKKALWGVLNNYTTEQLEAFCQKCRERFEKTTSSQDILFIAKSIMIIYAIHKIFPSNIQQFDNYLSKFYTEKSSNVQIYQTFVLAKLCKQEDSAFSRKKITICHSKIKDSIDLQSSAYFLYYLSKYCTHTIMIDFAMYLDCIRTLLTKKLDLMPVCTDSVHNFMHYLASKTEDAKANHINKLLATVDECIGDNQIDLAFGILSVILDHKFSYPHLKNKAEAINLLISKYTVFKNLKCHELILWCQIKAAPLNLEMFRIRFLVHFLNNLMDLSTMKTISPITASTYIEAIKLFPEYFKKSDITKTLAAMLSNPNIHEGYILLSMMNEIPKYDPYLPKKMNKILPILQSAQITPNYVEYMPGIFKKIPELWGVYKHQFLQQMLQLLKKPDILALKVLAKCHPINSPELLNILSQLLVHPNDNIRAAAPAAYLHHGQFLDAKILSQMTDQLLTSCMCEKSWKSRLSIIEAFNQATCRYLSSITALRWLEVLANDENIDVKKAALNLLVNLSNFSPLTVEPVIRHLILNSMFILKAPGSHRLRAETSRLLSVIAKATDLLPIYIDDMMNTIIAHFSQPPSSKMTYFESISHTETSLNFIDLIKTVTNVNFDLIKTHALQLVNVGIRILHEYSDKKLKVSVVETITAIVPHLTDEKDFDRQNLAAEIISIAEKYNSRSLSLAIMKLLGLLGAVDPSLMKNNENTTNENVFDDVEIDVNKQSYYLTVTCNSLLNVLNDQSLSSDHNDVAIILVLIFCTKDPSLYGPFKRFIPLFIDMIRVSRKSVLLEHLQKLCTQSPAAWLTNYSDEIISLIYELWTTDALNDILSIIPALASVLLDRFSPFLPQCISLLLDCLHSHRTSNDQISEKVINSILALRRLSHDYIFLIIPDLTSAVTYSMTLKKVRIHALVALRVMIQSMPLKSFSGEIIRCINVTLKLRDPQLTEYALQVLYSLQVSISSTFEPYIEQVSPLIYSDKSINPAYFNELNERIKKQQVMSFSDFPWINQSDPSKVNLVNEELRPKTSFNEQKLFEAVDYKDEENYTWQRKEWFRRFVFSVISNSPVLCINLTASIAQHIQQVTDALFNIGFLSCWEQMSPNYQAKMQSIISKTIKSDFPPGCKSMLISLVEFMDRAESPLGISYQLLCECCKVLGHHAQAYYFASRWYINEGTLEAKDSMVFLASNLGLKENCFGLVTTFENGEIPPIWYEQLGDWNHALEGYKNKNDIDGIVRCHAKLMHWDEVIEEKEKIISRNGNIKPLITALHFKGQHKEVLDLVSRFTNEGPLPRLYAAVSALICNKKEIAVEIIEKAREILTQQARNRFKHDKSLLYKTLVHAMAFNEVLEQANGTVNKKQWQERLSLSRPEYDEFREIFDVRRPCLNKEEITSYNATLISRARLTRDWGAFDSFVSNITPEMMNTAQIQFSIARFIYSRGQQQEAIDRLKNINLEGSQVHIQARIKYMIGHYILRMHPPDQIHLFVKDAIPYFQEALKIDPTYYRAQHRLAWAYSQTWHSDPAKNSSFALEAVLGFISSVNMRPNSSFSDLIQMIMIVFTTNLSDDVFQQVKRCISNLDPTYVLLIIPQLCAQITRGTPRNTEFAKEVISSLLPHHYNTLLYPLLQMLNDENKNEHAERGREIAKEILSKFRSVNHVAVQQASDISEGLFQAAYTQLERWLVIISQINLALADNNIEAAKVIFKQYYPKIENPVTPDEVRFAAFYRPGKLDNILSIFDQKQSFMPDRRSMRIRHSLQQIDKEMKQHLESIRALKLPDLAPKLGSLKNFVLAVPGTFKAGHQLVTIESVDPLLEVIVSKQHPRIIVFHGSDGKPHRSLLKGHEDLRLDQRVMQFFQLMNLHIKNGPNTRMRNLALHTFAITPISNRSGIIQFIDDTDTFNQLITSYRKQRRININLEKDIISNNFTSSVDEMTTVQRYEALLTAIQSTDDNDLEKAIWMRSPSSNEWIKRTTRFAQTSAVMSIIGYILGLGDRHPSNLMMHKSSGDVIHIDFSDCFEIAKTREQFPEGVPFRLTRMMVRAFGPARIEGNFRIAAEEMMKIVRSHRESIMTVLDIFLQVPIESEEESELSKLDIHAALDRITDKIVGRDFGSQELSIEDQVRRLINDATNVYNLATLYHGWTPLW